MLTLSPGTNVLCEVALEVGSGSVLLGEGQQKPGSRPAQEMALISRAGLSLCLLSLLLAAALHPQPLRPQRSVPEEFSAPLELSQPLSDLLDDYGIQPKHPRRRRPRPLLSRAQQRKRDGPDMAEYYFDTRL
ncbi:protein Frey 1 [Myotis yumanensis]|uniref:protein Frey 1 n=1 Tax=Myotis yumanensis TaxID=159337 RepID=UPI0038D3AFAE